MDRPDPPKVGLQVRILLEALQASETAPRRAHNPETAVVQFPVPATNASTDGMQTLAFEAGRGRFDSS